MAKKQVDAKPEPLLEFQEEIRQGIPYLCIPAKEAEKLQEDLLIMAGFELDAKKKIYSVERPKGDAIKSLKSVFVQFGLNINIREAEISAIDSADLSGDLTEAEGSVLKDGVKLVSQYRRMWREYNKLDEEYGKWYAVAETFIKENGFHAKPQFPDDAVIQMPDAKLHWQHTRGRASWAGEEQFKRWCEAKGFSDRLSYYVGTHGKVEYAKLLEAAKKAGVELLEFSEVDPELWDSFVASDAIPPQVLAAYEQRKPYYKLQVYEARSFTCSCGQEVKKDQKYCDECGKDLREATVNYEVIHGDREEKKVA